MDRITQDAFRDLWRLWQDNQNIGNDPAAWDAVIREAGNIVERSAAACDPDFITDFGIAVVTSLERLNIKCGRV